MLKSASLSLSSGDILLVLTEKLFVPVIRDVIGLGLRLAPALRPYKAIALALALRLEALRLEALALWSWLEYFVQGQGHFV